MPYAEAFDDQIYVQTELRDKELIKQVPGARWDKDKKMWHVPLSWAACVALRGVFGEELQTGDELNQWAVNARHYWIDKVAPLHTAMEEASLMESEPNLFPFQRVGVHFLETAGRALLADDMGSGKTIQLIRTIARLQESRGNALPVLVVCPNSMKYTWKAEIEKWYDGVEVAVIDGSKTVRDRVIEEAITIVNPETGEDFDAPAYDFYIINWESLRLHSRLSPYGSIALSEKEKTPGNLNRIPFMAVIADEAHRAKDPKSKQTRALKFLGKEATYRFAATGTPIESSPDQYWSLMNFISPADFPRKVSFIDRYCQQAYNPFGGMDIIGLNPATAPEFHVITEPRKLRRPKDVILPQLPPKVESMRYLTMVGKQKKAYDDMAKHMLAELKNGEVIAALNPLNQFMRLSQFASAYAELDDDGDMKLATPSNKIDAFLELLEEAEGEQVVTFAESKQLIDLVAAELVKKDIPHGLITGDQDAARRQVVMEQFQAGNLRVVLCTSAGAEGITLTSARILVFLQRFWSSIKNKQAADRVHRIGQERGVEIITFATRGTVDEYRELQLEEKEVALQEILQDEDIRKEMLGWGKKKR